MSDSDNNNNNNNNPLILAKYIASLVPSPLIFSVRVDAYGDIFLQNKGTISFIPLSEDYDPIVEIIKKNSFETFREGKFIIDEDKTMFYSMIDIFTEIRSFLAKELKCKNPFQTNLYKYVNTIKFGNKVQLTINPNLTKEINGIILLYRYIHLNAPTLSSEYINNVISILKAMKSKYGK